MIDLPHKHVCQVKHDPPNSYGDCLRATIATLTHTPHVENVPHFLRDGDGERGEAELRDWLRAQGYALISFGLPGSITLADVFSEMKACNPDVPYMLYCERNGGDHVVICENDKVIHDTAWVTGPIAGPQPSSDTWGIRFVVRV